jgi:hypothetical protein
MSLTTRTLAALNNGISRQPAILRSQDQTEDEVNTWGQIATGVSRRPPTRLVKSLGVQNFDNAMVHHINRDVSERYIVIVKQGSIRVFDEETGAEQVVNAPGGFGYLDQVGVAYRAVTVADYTFIVNTAKVPALYVPPTGTAPGTPPPEYTDPVVNPGGPRVPRKVDNYNIE